MRNSFLGPCRTLNENDIVETSVLNRIRQPTENRQTHVEEVININKDVEIYRINNVDLLNLKRLY
jgi:hypothetical protein